MKFKPWSIIPGTGLMVDIVDAKSPRTPGRYFIVTKGQFRWLEELQEIPMKFDDIAPVLGCEIHIDGIETVFPPLVRVTLTNTKTGEKLEFIRKKFAPLRQ